MSAAVDAGIYLLLQSNDVVVCKPVALQTYSGNEYA